MLMFVANMLAAQQYYPFGMLMPGDTSANVRRQYSLNTYDYRYGFNGKEGDDEVKGDDNQQDYGMRIYDPRVARFLSVDPLESKYPYFSPYHAFANNPIYNIDPDGGKITPHFSVNEAGKLIITLKVTGKVIDLSGKLFSPISGFTSELNEYDDNWDGNATGIKIKYGGNTYTEAIVKFDFAFQATEKISEITEDDHLFVLAPYRTNIKQIAQGITNFQGAMVMHIDADFAQGPIDDFTNRGLKIATHELFSHAFSIGSYGHDAGDGKDDLVGDKDVGENSFPEVTDKQRGMMVNSVIEGKVNIGPVLVPGRGGLSKLPNMSYIGLSATTFRFETGSIGDYGFDIRKEIEQALKKQ